MLAQKSLETFWRYYIYIYIYIYQFKNCWYSHLHNPSPMSRMQHKFKFSSEFSRFKFRVSLLLYRVVYRVAYQCLKKPSQLIYLSIARGIIVWFIFSTVFAFFEISRLGFELGSPCLFLTTIHIILVAPVDTIKFKYNKTEWACLIDNSIRFW